MFEYLTQQEVYSQPEALKKTLVICWKTGKKSPDFSAATKEEELWSWLWLHRYAGQKQPG